MGSASTSRKLEDIELELLLEDGRYYAETLISIRTEDGPVRPILFNDVQNSYWDLKSKRDVILKARRVGMTTIAMIRGLHKCQTIPGHISKIVTHTNESAADLFDDLKIMYRSIPQDFRVKSGYDNRTEMTFPELDSKISITSCGKTAADADALGRSGTIHFLHLSEYALWTLPKRALTAILPCVPIRGGEVCIESTARGFNDYYNRWKMAVRNLDVWKPHFFPWTKDPKCSLSLKPGEAKRLLNPKDSYSLTFEERELILKHALTLEQIKWRRFKISEIGADVFPQEYPIDDNECFIESGNPFFNNRALKAILEKVVRQPLAFWPGGQVVPRGWRVFVPPRPGHRYVGGGDCSEGTIEGDNDSAVIIDRVTCETVCHIYGKFGPKNFAKQIALATKIYNNDVYWGIEKNNHGHTVLQALVEIEKMPTKQLYHHIAYDAAQRRRIKRKVGWLTDQKSRPIMLDDLADAIEHSNIIIYDNVIVEEGLSFVVDETGKPGAQSGANDDSIIATSIGWQMRKQRSFKQVGW